MNKKVIGLLAAIAIAILAVIVWIAGPAGASETPGGVVRPPIPVKKAAYPSIPFLSIGYCAGPGKIADYTLDAPITEGVVYKVNGVVLTHMIVKQGSTVTVVAYPTIGYYIPDGVRTTFTWDTNTFGPDCGKAPAPKPRVVTHPVVKHVTPTKAAAAVVVTHEAQPSLANTGPHTGLMLLIGSGLVLSGAGLLALGRRSTI